MRADPTQGLLSYGPIRIKEPQTSHSSKFLNLESSSLLKHGLKECITCFRFSYENPKIIHSCYPEFEMPPHPCVLCSPSSSFNPHSLRDSMIAVLVELYSICYFEFKNAFIYFSCYFYLCFRRFGNDGAARGSRLDCGPLSRNPHHCGQSRQQKARAVGRSTIRTLDSFNKSSKSLVSFCQSLN